MPAKGTLKFRVTPVVLERAEKKAREGLTQEDIAKSLGICEDTLYEYKKKNPEFAEAIARGYSKERDDLVNVIKWRARRKTLNPTAQKASEWVLAVCHGMKMPSMIDARTLNLNAGNGNGSEGGTDAADEQHSDDDLRAEILSSLDRIAAASRAPSVVIDQKPRST